LIKSAGPNYGVSFFPFRFLRIKITVAIGGKLIKTKLLFEAEKGACRSASSY